MGPISTLHVKRAYANRIDILKRLGKALSPYGSQPGEHQVKLSNGQIVNRETLKRGLHINGKWVDETNYKEVSL